MSSWADFREELNRWQDAEQPATLWWRDDDATDSTPASDRLLRLADAAGVPLHMAVIPALQSESLVATLRATAAESWVLQHGYAHINHAPLGERACEVGIHRPSAAVLQELSQGFEILRERHGERFLPVLVPPWNRVAPRILPGLPELGLRGVSCFSPRSESNPAPGLLAVNTHCDPIKWKEGRGFAGTEAALREVTEHLSARRLGKADAAEPTGLLTHHLDMDEATWAFVEQLIDHSTAQLGAKWIAIGDLLGGA
jgi:hypothetical protein